MKLNVSSPPLVALLLVVPMALASPGCNPAAGTNQAISIYSFESSCNSALRTGGACGLSTYFPNVDENASFFAMPWEVFDQYGRSQHNVLCGKQIQITHNGVVEKAIVADRNGGGDNSIDTCPDLWQAFGGHDGNGTLIRVASWVMLG
ncbi:hypothetical protein A9K55_002148 [Cordyceps militaris]|uniref:Uncharacterized protein n=1 Tax=Cordyceps militaris TaxID=73501 RepID=A0A2H4SQP3_CORMI|nr:hypothetical protein A9K55_002148 [Cordyceps militaris]